jgi:hypothetical protein
MALVQLAAGRREVPFEEQLVGLKDARDHYNALADRVRDEYSAADVPLLAWGQERAVRRIAQAYEKSIANLTAKAALHPEGGQSQAPALAVSVATVEIPRWQLMALFAVSIFAVAAGLVGLTHSSAPSKFPDSNPPAPSVSIPVLAPRIAMPENSEPPHVAPDMRQADAPPNAAVTPQIEVPSVVPHRASRPALHRHSAHAVLHKKISRTRKHQSLRSSAPNHL